jgi:hypothetical protein
MVGHTLKVLPTNAPRSPPWSFTSYPLIVPDNAYEKQLANLKSKNPHKNRHAQAKENETDIGRTSAKLPKAERECERDDDATYNNPDRAGKNAENTLGDSVTKNPITRTPWHRTIAPITSAL